MDWPCWQKTQMSLIWPFGVLVDSLLFPGNFAALYWKRTTKQGAIASIIAALLTWLYYFHESGYGGEYMVGPGIVPAAICFGASAIVLIAVSLFTKPPSEETLDKFFPKKSEL